jgi:alpha-1,2-glucosyltransferase
MNISIPSKLTPITLFLLVLIFLLCLSRMREVPPLVDEIYHQQQIARFLRGDISLEPMISTLPGYHMVVAGIAYILRRDSISDLRSINLGLSVLSALVFYLLTFLTYGEYKPLKLFQYLFFPVLFPFFFLVYTDTFSLLLVMLGFSFVNLKKYNLSAIVGLISIVVRQNNIVWVGLMFLYAYYDLNGLQLRQAGKTLSKLLIFCIVFLSFGIFTIINQGVAVGDETMHPSFQLHMGNVYFILFLFFILFLPLNIYKFPSMIKFLSSKPWLLALLVPAYVFYMLSFKNDHIYNLINTEYFLRNIILVKATSNFVWKTVFFIPIIYSLISLAVTSLNSARFYLLYPFTMLYLFPSWLVEPRYTLIPFALFILYKREMPTWLEYLTATLWMLASYQLLTFTSDMKYFI